MWGSGLKLIFCIWFLFFSLSEQKDKKLQDFDFQLSEGHSAECLKSDKQQGHKVHADEPC